MVPARKPASRICDAPGCTVEVKRGILMCRPHWFSLPKQLQRAISDTWRSGQIRAWSANCLEARKFLVDRAGKAAAIAARTTGDRA